jgi:regulator of replication initiation timing
LKRQDEEEKRREEKRREEKKGKSNVGRYYPNYIYVCNFASFASVRIITFLLY